VIAFLVLSGSFQKIKVISRTIPACLICPEPASLQQQYVKWYAMSDRSWFVWFGCRGTGSCRLQNYPLHIDMVSPIGILKPAH
jgi:hypothetical protein